MRRILGKFIEWCLGYDHVVIVDERKVHKSPFRNYNGDAGSDLFCSENTIVPSGGSALVPSGVHIDPESKIWFHLLARSSTFKNLGLEVVTAVIDREYRGELFAQVLNPTEKDVLIKQGTRITQIVPHRLIPVRFILGKVSDSPRGHKGFGSSGA